MKGVGLRGGRFTGVFDPETTRVNLSMRGLRFSRDVTVSGRASLDFTRGSFARARNRVDGPSGADGRLRLRGSWFAPDAKVIHISGRLGGRRVEAIVPAG